MKKYFPFFLLWINPFYISCEKDDICVSGDTPLMVVVFYDKDNRSTKKAVNGLAITSKDKNQNLTLEQRDSIAIPLKTSSKTTTFILTKNDNSTNPMNPVKKDEVPFNYLVEEKFISRACGFVAHYKELNTSFSSPGTWIEEIEITTSIIQLQNIAVHVKIYH